jgi:hypothetical protein
MGAQQRILFQQQTTAGLAEMTPRPTCKETRQLFVQLDMIFVLHEGSASLGPFEQLAGRNLVPLVVVKVAEFLGAVGRTGVELPSVVTTTAVATAAGVLEQQGGAVRAAIGWQEICVGTNVPDPDPPDPDPHVFGPPGSGSTS